MNKSAILESQEDTFCCGKCSWKHSKAAETVIEHVEKVVQGDPA